MAGPWTDLSALFLTQSGILGWGVLNLRPSLLTILAALPLLGVQVWFWVLWQRRAAGLATAEGLGLSAVLAQALVLGVGTEAYGFPLALGQWALIAALLGSALWALLRSCVALAALVAATGLWLTAMEVSWVLLVVFLSLQVLMLLPFLWRGLPTRLEWVILAAGWTLALHGLSSSSLHGIWIPQFAAWFSLLVLLGSSLEDRGWRNASVLGGFGFLGLLVLAWALARPFPWETAGFVRIFQESSLSQAADFTLCAMLSVPAAILLHRALGREQWGRSLGGCGLLVFGLSYYLAAAEGWARLASVISLLYALLLTSMAFFALRVFLGHLRRPAAPSWGEGRGPFPLAPLPATLLVCLAAPWVGPVLLWSSPLWLDSLGDISRWKVSPGLASAPASATGTEPPFLLESRVRAPDRHFWPGEWAYVSFRVAPDGWSRWTEVSATRPSHRQYVRCRLLQRQGDFWVLDIPFTRSRFGAGRLQAWTEPNPDQRPRQPEPPTALVVRSRHGLAAVRAIEAL